MMKTALQIIGICAWMVGLALPAEDPAFEKASLGWRTALHFDPGAEAPLQSLFHLYQRGQRITELFNLYTQHLAQFPADEGAKAVLARLYLKAGDGRAEALLNQAVAEHPANALLAYVRSRAWQTKLDPRALEELDRAVMLEPDNSRRANWLGELLQAAASAQREEVVVKRLTELAGEPGGLSKGQRLVWARRALESGMSRAAAAVMVGVDPAALQGDEGIEARFLLARVALHAGQEAEAAQQAAELLERLAPDHWRRKEALALRWQALRDGQEREAVLHDLERRWHAAPDSETAALAYGDLLVAAERQEKAVEVWRKALERLPESRAIEERVLEVLEDSRRTDAALDFLKQRLREQPGREDLALRLARNQLLLGRVDDGMAALEGLADGVAADRATVFMQTARWLRSRNVFAEAAVILEKLVETEPERWEARKELAELYRLLGRSSRIGSLFEGEVPAGLPKEVRLEVAQMLVSDKLWETARRLLEEWVAVRKTEFEGRLLLANVRLWLGNEAGALALLDEARALADTEARYAAWLAAAWERAEDSDSLVSLLERERARIWPGPGEVWDNGRLARLSLLVQQTAAPALREEAEKLIRAALEAADLPAEDRRELRDQLIRVLDGQAGKEKTLEEDLVRALKEPGAVRGDLQVRLALTYHAAQRLDLARSALGEVEPSACRDAGLTARAGKMAESLGMGAQASALLGQVVRLQPDDRGAWIDWTSLLIQLGDEEELRLALREMQARAQAWKLSDNTKDLLRRHLAASYWRTVGSVLARSHLEEPDFARVLAVLDELERVETQKQRRLWSTWTRGVIARKIGEKDAAERAVKSLAESEQEWVDFPDGLSLAVRQAQALIQKGDLKPAGAARTQTASEPPPLPPVKTNWVYTVEEGVNLQRWELTADGGRVLVADTRQRLTLLDRGTGKVLWQRRLPRSLNPVPVLAAAVSFPNGSEQIQYPPEWAMGTHCVAVVSDGGVFGLNQDTGEVMWQQRSPGGEGRGGVLAAADGRILSWNATDGRLDAIDEATGKLLWTRRPIPGWKPEVRANQEVRWLSAGISADGGQVLVWGDGGAVLRVEDGAPVWRAHMGQRGPAFPLELTADDSVTPRASERNLVLPWITAGAPQAGLPPRSARVAAANPIVYANALAAQGYGFPGMYGSSTVNQALTWGGEQTRLLHGEGIWSLYSGGAQRYSMLGLPTGEQRPVLFSGMPAVPVGFAGKSLIYVTEYGVSRHDPAWGVSSLWSSTVRGRGGLEHPLPAAALSGTSLLLATNQVLRVQDTLTGTELWQTAWPRELEAVLKKARESLGGWQSMRWTSRGLFLYDGRGRTLTMDWKGLVAGGDWIVPTGTRTLVCLRGTKPGVESSHENRVSD